MSKSKTTEKSIIDMPSKEQLDQATKPYADEELQLSPDMEAKIEKLLEFFDKSNIDYDNFDLFDTKKAYPNYDQYMHIPGQHNTQKWLTAVKEIYIKEKNGESRVSAIRHVTSGWNVMETFDFLNWLKYHESGDHMKYKFAQLWYENGAPGYFLHVKQDSPKEPEPQVSGKDIDFAKDSVKEEMTNTEKKQIIEKQRSKIIGRLDSAEKLLRSPDGQIFSGKEFESLMEAIYQLKKKVQMVNKISTSIRLYEDMIVREANILQRKGLSQAAEVLYKIAQTPGASGEQAKGTSANAGKVPAATPPAPPAQPSGAPGGLPSLGPGMPQPPGNPPTAPSDNQPIPKGISEFLEGMDTGKLTTTEDKNVSKDQLEVEDPSSLEIFDAEDQLLVTEAQIAPAGPPPAALEEVPMTDAPAPVKLKPSPVSPPSLDKEKSDKSEKPLEVTEDDLPTEEPQEITSDFDSKVDALLADVTVKDIVYELENLSKIFKTREIPRRLSLVDMMLDSLGLASFFPSLSEAQNKALESNNYISTRVDDILSNLRGKLPTKNIDLVGKDVDKPEVAEIKNKLKSDDEKEKARKQMRKEQEVADLENKNKETPEVEIAEDLGPAPKPAPAVPVAQPTR